MRIFLGKVKTPVLCTVVEQASLETEKMHGETAKTRRESATIRGEMQGALVGKIFPVSTKMLLPSTAEGAYLKEAFLETAERLLHLQSQVRCVLVVKTIAGNMACILMAMETAWGHC